MSSPPIPSSVFNSSLFTSNNALTQSVGDTRYVMIGSSANLASINSSGIINASSYQLGGSTLNFSAISGVVPGTASANQALIIDSSSNITGINSIGATTLTLSGISTHTNTTDSTSTSTGSIITSGGVGIAKSLYVGTNINLGNQLTIGSSLYYTGSPLTGAIVSYGGCYLGSSSYIFNLTTTLSTTSNYQPNLTSFGNGNTIINNSSSSTIVLCGNNATNTSYACNLLAPGSSNGLLIVGNNSLLNLQSNTSSTRTTILFTTQAGATAEYGFRDATSTPASCFYWYTNTSWLGTWNNTGLYINNTSGSASYPLHIAKSVNGISIPSTSGACAYFTTGSTSLTSIVGTTSASVSAYMSGACWSATGFYSTSDQRLKHNITELDDDVPLKILSINPIMFTFKEDKDHVLHLGYVAQDFVKNKLTQVITLHKNDELTEESEYDAEGIQYSIDYSKVCCYLHKTIQYLNSKIEDLTDRLNQIESRPDPVNTNNRSKKTKKISI